MNIYLKASLHLSKSAVAICAHTLVRLMLARAGGGGGVGSRAGIASPIPEAEEENPAANGRPVVASPGRLGGKKTQLDIR